MTQPAPARGLDELTLGSAMRLEELVDRNGLAELARSFFELFRVPLRVFSEDGKILADAYETPSLYVYLNGVPGARLALQEVIDSVKAVVPEIGQDATRACVTGAAYRVSAISYDGRRIGRMVLGPFLPPTVREVPTSLLALDGGLDPGRLKALLSEMPRAREETVGQLAAHLVRTLDLILFSGHKALLTSNMHLASVRASFHDLQAKNAKLEEAFERLKELDRLKSNFLATVSHELRTPLTSIIGYGEMLAEGIAGELNPEQQEFVQTIREKGEQLLELIKGLLDLSKLESGTMSMRKANLRIEEILEDVSTTLAPTARKKGVTLATRVQGSLHALWADAERLRQVFLNLTENAIKFTPEGGAVELVASPAMLDLSSDPEAGGFVLMATQRPGVEVRVADTGVGIPEEERKKVFDAFYQVDSSSTREAGGTGLGLSIVKRLVEGHDGTVHIESNRPRGAVFVVRIPAKRSTIA
ncbi:MAG: PocR ligand-binding domain-containing protein [Polyangiaceae bacterium]|nr:PocR ligand-binding domain-containing protein [Polyangiaceae bacterium]